MKKGFIGILAVLGFVLFASGIILAENPPVNTNVIVKKDLTILKTADLAVNELEAWPCGCETDAAAADAIILKGNPIVHVHNNGPFATDAMLKVRIWNLRTNSEVQHAYAIHLNNNQSLNQVISSMNASPTTPMLIKKSYGVKAEIVVSSTGTSDPNASNNVKIINVCHYTIE